MCPPVIHKPVFVLFTIKWSSKQLQSREEISKEKHFNVEGFFHITYQFGCAVHTLPYSVSPQTHLTTISTRLTADKHFLLTNFNKKRIKNILSECLEKLPIEKEVHSNFKQNKSTAKPFIIQQHIQARCENNLSLSTLNFTEAFDGKRCTIHVTH